jgi:ABC-type uncharacterized transport system permease subunit
MISGALIGLAIGVLHNGLKPQHDRDWAWVPGVMFEAAFVGMLLGAVVGVLS